MSLKVAYIQQVNDDVHLDAQQERFAQKLPKIVVMSRRLTSWK